MPPSVETRYRAAVLACGEGALLSGRAPAAPPPEVTAPTELRVRGVVTRRSRRFDRRERAVYHAIPLTTVARTHSSTLHPSSRRTTSRAPAMGAGKQAAEHWSRGLRRIMNGEVRVALSALEKRFLKRLRDRGLPLPQTDSPTGGRRVDCRWPDRRLTVELDGYRFHRSRHAWERDRRREREARARGDEFRRYTYGDVVEAPEHMLAELQALLAGA